MKKFVLSLTLSRIFIGPLIFIAIVFWDAYLLALVLFISFSLTDYLDGWLARKYDVGSDLGAVMDPIADKILLMFLLIALSLELRDPYVAFMSSLVLSREFWVSSLREYNAIKNARNITQASFLAKLKTSMQFFTIAIFLLSLSANFALGIFISKLLLMTSMFLTIYTGIDYTHKTFSKK